MGDNASAQREFLCTVEGIDGYWAQKTGGDPSAESRKVYNGGTLKPETITDPPTFENVTLVRPYKPARDGAMLKRVRKLVGVLTTTVTVQDTLQRLEPTGDPTIYPEARLVAIQEPERDAASGEGAMVGLVFAVDDVA